LLSAKKGCERKKSDQFDGTSSIGLSPDLSLEANGSIPPPSCPKNLAQGLLSLVLSSRECMGAVSDGCARPKRCSDCHHFGDLRIGCAGLPRFA
jgi:hypothetical protein